jgi:large subunit ribosomal protein L21e
MSTLRRRTRYKLKKPTSEKGKISIRAYLAEYKPGDKVILKTEPSIHGGIFHPKFEGKVGVIGGKAGDCYKVAIKDFTKAKTLLVHPIHLKRY